MLRKIVPISLLTGIAISIFQPAKWSIEQSFDNSIEVSEPNSKVTIDDRSMFSTKILLKRADIDMVNIDEVGEGDSSDEVYYVDLSVPSNKIFKSYMDARHITDTTSPQYVLKLEYELDYETGIYMVNGRYACALGSYYTTEIGTDFDIVMKSGSVIPCILAEIKADKHTDAMNQYTVSNNSVVEFVVNESILKPYITTRWGNTGDISTLGNAWAEEISYIRIYTNTESGD